MLTTRPPPLDHHHHRHHHHRHHHHRHHHHHVFVANCATNNFNQDVKARAWDNIALDRFLQINFEFFMSKSLRNSHFKPFNCTSKLTWNVTAEAGGFVRLPSFHFKEGFVCNYNHFSWIRQNIENHFYDFANSVQLKYAGTFSHIVMPHANKCIQSPPRY